MSQSSDKLNLKFQEFLKYDESCIENLRSKQIGVVKYLKEKVDDFLTADPKALKVRELRKKLAHIEMEYIKKRRKVKSHDVEALEQFSYEEDAVYCECIAYRTWRLYEVEATVGRMMTYLLWASRMKSLAWLYRSKKGKKKERFEKYINMAFDMSSSTSTPPLMLPGWRRNLVNVQAFSDLVIEESVRVKYHTLVIKAYGLFLQANSQAQKNVDRSLLEKALWELSEIKSAQGFESISEFAEDLYLEIYQISNR